jgi:hypothetical protein
MDYNGPRDGCVHGGRLRAWRVWGGAAAPERCMRHLWSAPRLAPPGSSRGGRIKERAALRKAPCLLRMEARVLRPCPHPRAHPGPFTPPPSPSEGIVRWIKKKTGPPAEKLADKDALDAAEKANEVVVLAYYKDLKVGGGAGEGAQCNTEGGGGRRRPARRPCW